MYMYLYMCTKRTALFCQGGIQETIPSQKQRCCCFYYNSSFRTHVMLYTVRIYTCRHVCTHVHSNKKMVAIIYYTYVETPSKKRT